MKKIYKAPVMRVAEIETEALIAQSPRIQGGPGMGDGSITDGNMDGFSMDAKGDITSSNAWDDEDW